MGAEFFIKSLCIANRKRVVVPYRQAVRVRDTLYEESERLKSQGAAAAVVVAVEKKLSIAQARVEELGDEYVGGDGFFRDPDNVASLFRRLRKPDGKRFDVSDVEGYVTEEHLSVEGARSILELLERSRLILPSLEELRAQSAEVADDPEDPNSLKAWHRHFLSRRKKFMGILKRAIEMDEPIFFR
jgi:hypothetical protein